jgi:dimethylamine/trimethylamine dehydrogenase
LNLEVNIFTGKTVTGFDGDSAEITCVYTGKTFRQPASSVVTVTARIPNDEIYRQLSSDPEVLNERGIKSVVRIGDSRAPGIIAAAVYAGHRLAREMDAPESEGISFRRERVTI